MKNFAGAKSPAPHSSHKSKGDRQECAGQTPNLRIDETACAQESSWLDEGFQAVRPMVFRAELTFFYG